MEKIYTKCLKHLNNRFQLKKRTTLGPSIFGTSSDRDNPIFSAERGGQSDGVEVYNRDLIGSAISKTMSSPLNLPAMPNYRSIPPGD